MDASSDSGYGVNASSHSGVAVNATSVLSNGVLASASNPTYAGVEGDNSGGGPGVVGNTTDFPQKAPPSQWIGVWGLSDLGIGVVGTSAHGAHAAVLGHNTGGNTGVRGVANSSTGSKEVAAVVGVNGGSDAGVAGVNTGSGPGVAGSSASGLAGLFNGSVTVNGALTVTGAKSAAVRDAGGTLRRLYSLESPESWFEDFGSGQLEGGSATVQLEPGFAGVVEADDYHVFLTPDRETEMLHVTGKTPTSFRVREGHGGTSSVGFSYRVVARRRDIDGVRLEYVDEPPAPALPDFF